MNQTDWIVVAVGGVVGWGLVSLVAYLVRQQRKPPVVFSEAAPRQQTGAVTRDTLTVAEVASTWHEILEVPQDASGSEIEAAYHARIGECDRIRFSAAESTEERRMAGIKRSRVSQAYEFIRPLKGPG